jgi:hypothetical protein
MHAILKAGLLAAFLSTAAPLALARPAPSPAMELVQRQHLGGNLKTIALAAAQKTETYAVLASGVGADQAKALVSKQLDSHARQFEGKWNKNLADIYAQHFTPEELTSLASEGSKSKYAGKMAEKQAEIGGEMRSRSTPILVSYVAAAMKSALAQASAKPAAAK